MCGIAGALVFDNDASGFVVEDGYLTRMQNAMAHRGPDGAGSWISDDRRVGLGHRRLAVVDLSDKASQPMSNEDGTLWVTFNGEIYNHREIRDELEQEGGHLWRSSHSDTEVIVHSFERWGINCLEKFRGMFAMAVWDAKACELWLIRDRVGIKPLYYSVHHGRLVFASEIKALLCDPDYCRGVDEEALYHYLTFLTTPPPATLFQGINKLSSGTWMRVKMNGQILKRRYWDVWDHVSPLAGVSEDEIAERLLAQLQESVHLRKTGDVPVGLFLSGGVDSSANLALFSEFGKNPVQTFTIRNSGNHSSSPDETNWAKFVAERNRAVFHEKTFDEDDFIEFLPRMVWHQDEPLADPVCVPLYFISQDARKHGVVVCQAGEGADELFGGYPTWLRDLRLARLNGLRIPRLVKSAGLLGLESVGKKGTSYHEWLRRGTEGQPVFWGTADSLNDVTKRRLLSPRLRKKFSALSSWDVIRPIHERFKQNAWDQSHLNWMSYSDLSLRLPELLLMRIDKMSMAVGVEARVPFLDHRFVEFALSVPAAVRMKNGSLKYILKKALDGVIPQEVINRPKQGFHAPVHEWSTSRLGNRVQSELREFCRDQDFFDPGEMGRFVKGANGMAVWGLYNFCLWWKEFVGQRSG